MTLRFVVPIALLSLPAVALQPLNAFVISALDRNPDVLEARALSLQQRAQSDVALGRVLPGISARGAYTRNQYDARLGNITIVPIDQWDASATLSVPLVDAAGWIRVSAGKISANAADLQLASARLSIQAQVAQDYYQLVADLALQAAARKALEASRENLRLAQSRYEAGVGQVLDVDRATADVEQQNQQVAGTGLQVSLAARALEVTSGLRPEAAGIVPLEDDLHAEPPLESFEEGFDRLPPVMASAEERRAAERLASAQLLSALPTVTASMTERGTTNAGLGGHDWSWQALVALNWTLDFTTPANVRAQDAAADAARARDLRVRLAAREAIERHWDTVTAGIVRSRSARAGAAAATRASEQARSRYQAGTVTQLDLLQAQRDAFAAEAGRIQADADLVNARAQLRLAAGRTLAGVSQ